MVFIASLHNSHVSCFDLESKQRCHVDRSHASLALVTHQQLVVVSAMEVPVAGGVSQGAPSTEVVDVGPQLGDRAWGLSQDLVVHGIGAGVLRSAALGDAASAPRPLSTFSPGVPGLYMSGFFSSLPLPINWRWVEDEAESTCLQVAIAERLLHEMLASAHRNILRPIWVSLKRGAKSCPHSNGFLRAFSSLPCFCFHNFYVGVAWMCLLCWRS
jgi:hypothetical protein